MNKYLITITVIASGKQVGYIAFGSSQANAETDFFLLNPGLLNTDLYTHAIAIQL